MSSTLSAIILTLSDKGSVGEREDKSGKVVKTLLENAGYEILEQVLLPDEKALIEAELVRFCDVLDAALVITTGGTGFSPRDITPEATLAIAHRNVPGISEAIRAFSMKLTKRAMLSRGASVIRNRTLIINLPGSPKAVKECLEHVLPELQHGIEVLREFAGECGG